ncbi:hypothetical protein MMC28_010246 [Mycoblastus sanguinarius]|nr:hypothetical protein [Mycoblastus sanguinarius]
MGKKKSKSPNSPKKSMVGRKVEIDKLVEASKKAGKKPLQQPIVRLPPNQKSPVQDLSPRQPKQVLRRPSPKKILPNLKPEQDYLILDQRRPGLPATPLILLPKEPSTPRALRFALQGLFPFLELPGEIRNKIYDYTITDDYYVINWVNSHHKSKTLTHQLPRLGKAFSPHLRPDATMRRRLLDYHRRAQPPKCLPEEDLSPGRTALLLTCKTINAEASTVFYSKSTFAFSGLGALRHFLDNLSSRSKESITRLALKYRAYGNPLLTEDQPWKARHDRLWEDLCWRLADECTSLSHLSLDMTLNKSPVTFASFDQVDEAGFGAQWIKPLWAFQDADIERCWCRLRCVGKEETILEVESWKLRKEIQGDKWDDDTESKRDAYGFEESTKRPKKGMVLRIRDDGGLEGV